MNWLPDLLGILSGFVITSAVIVVVDLIQRKADD